MTIPFPFGTTHNLQYGDSGTRRRKSHGADEKQKTVLKDAGLASRPVTAGIERLRVTMAFTDQ
jgi:hypothetical protein